MTAIATRPAAEIELSPQERALLVGDLSKLTEDQRAHLYVSVCESTGLNPLTRPFEYITLNGKLTLYARKDCTEQLRRIHTVGLTIVSRENIEGVFAVTAQAKMGNGRTDESIGAVTIKGLQGDALCNAIMKAETKAKRRVTLSICGLGMLDETELETIPSNVISPAQPAPVGTEEGKARAIKARAEGLAPDAKALRHAFDALLLLGEKRSFPAYLAACESKWLRPGGKSLTERSTSKVMLSKDEVLAAYAIINDDIAKRKGGTPETAAELADHSAVRNTLEGEVIETGEVIYCDECGAQTHPKAAAEPHEATCKNAPLPKATEANLAILRTELKRLHGKDEEAISEWLYGLLGASSVDEIAEKGTDADCLLAIKNARAERVEDNIATS